MNFESAVEFLRGFKSYEDKGFPEYNEKNFGVERVRAFLKIYGVGFDRLKYVHVAGSKGKSSTSFMTARYLCADGFKTGLFVTPYIVDVTECFWVNGRTISKSLFVKYVVELKKFISGIGGTNLTYFELLTVLVLKYFVDCGVDYAVVEVALGGRLDATNVICPKVAALTFIEKEHTEVLGNTFGKILNEKLGVVVGKPNVVLVVGRQTKHVEKLIRKKTKSVKKMVFVRKNVDGVVEKNAEVVREILIALLGSVDEVKFEKIVDGFNMTGRLDVRLYKGRTVVFDMAHTRASAHELRLFLRKKFSDKKFIFLVSIMKKKNVRGIYSEIIKIAEKVLLTSSHVVRGYSGLELKNLVGRFGSRGFVTEENCLKAFDSIIKKMGRSDVLVVTGSHFLVGRILEARF